MSICLSICLSIFHLSVSLTLCRLAVSLSGWRAGSEGGARVASRLSEVGSLSQGKKKMFEGFFVWRMRRVEKVDDSTREF